MTQGEVHAAAATWHADPRAAEGGREQPGGARPRIIRLPSAEREFRLREIEWHDAEGLQAVARLHMELLDYGPMAGLGERFIRDAIYQQHVRDGSLRVALYEVDGVPVGFVAYTDNPWTFHRVTLRRHWLHTAWILLLALAREPARLRKVVRAIRVVLSRRGEVEIAREGVGEVICAPIRSVI